MGITSLRVIPLFQEVAQSELEHLVRGANWHRSRRGQAILEPLEATGHVFIVLEGRVLIGGRAPGGKEVDVFFLGSGDVIDLDDLPAPLAEYVYVEADSEEVVACRISRPAFRQAVFSHPASAARLDRQASRRLLDLALLLWEFAFQDARHRLRHVLAQLAEESPDHMVPLTREELGRRTGIRREDVTKFLKRLRDQGLIDYEAHHRGIKVLDIVGLSSDPMHR